MNSGALTDFLQQYVNSIGTATAMFTQSGDPLALDVIKDNLTGIGVLVAELETRTKANPYTPVPNAHLEKLTAEFLKRQKERELSASGLSQPG